jgi:hypothetical protein
VLASDSQFDDVLDAIDGVAASVAVRAPLLVECWVAETILASQLDDTLEVEEMEVIAP